jgi:hypothetical protein
MTEKGIEFWFDVQHSAENKEPIQGLLLSRKTRGTGKKAQSYYTIKITQPMKARQKQEDGTYLLLDVPKNTIVGIDEKAALEKLAKLLEQEAVFEVFILATEKVDLDNGNTFWRFNVGSRETNLSDVPF